MLVQCPSCRTTYRVGDKVVTIPNPTFRCSRCKHIFIVRVKPGTSARRDSNLASPRSGPQHSEEAPELSFSFPLERKETKEERDKKDFEFIESKEAAAIETPAHDRSESSKLQIQEPSFVADDHASLRELEEYRSSIPKNDGLSFVLAPERVDYGSTISNNAEGSLTIVEENESFQTKDFPKGTDKPETDLPPPPLSLEKRESLMTANSRPEQRLSTLPYLTLFCCLLLFYSVLTFVNRADPETTEAIIKDIPLLGASLFKNNHLRQQIDLQSLHSSFQAIPGSREVLVISGMALNHNPMSVRGIQVEGNIYNAEGREIERQVVWVGNAISPKIIRGMTPQEISDIQKLPPLKRFEIGPEETTSFAIVFFKAREEIKYFSCRVLSADEVT
jgi:predicted Zn finger-like uncharacterized protein